MALIKCEDCGKEVSDKAQSCIHCGCPMAKRTGDVLIHFSVTNKSQLIFQKCAIYEHPTDEVLAEGRQNQTLSINISTPTEIYLSVKNYKKCAPFIVNAGDRFNVRYTFMGKLLVEKVDIISVGDNTSNFNI